MTGGIEWLGEEQSGFRMQHFKGTLILTEHIMDSIGSPPMSDLGMPHLWILPTGPLTPPELHVSHPHTLQPWQAPCAWSHSSESELL